MALDGNHSIGSGGHVDDHNLIDAKLNSLVGSASGALVQSIAATAVGSYQDVIIPIGAQGYKVFNCFIGSPNGCVVVGGSDKTIGYGHTFGDYGTSPGIRQYGPTLIVYKPTGSSTPTMAVTEAAIESSNLRIRLSNSGQGPMTVTSWTFFWFVS